MTPKPKKPVDVLPLDIAVQLAESLHGIKNAPQRSGALQATVRDLREWCEGVWSEKDGRFTPDAEGQAEWLVAEAREQWDEWHGPRALKAIFDAKFQPALKLFEDSGPTPAVKCLGCNDTGAVEDHYHVWRWCVCRYAIELEQTVPDYVDLCNKRATLQKVADRVPIPTQEEIDRIKTQQEANRKERQP